MGLDATVYNFLPVLLVSMSYLVVKVLNERGYVDGRKVYFLIGSLFYAVSLSFIGQNLIAVKSMVIMLSNMYLAQQFLRNSYCKHVLNFSFYVIIIFVIYQVLGSNDYDVILVGASRNYLWIFVFILATIATQSSSKNNVLLSCLPFLLTTILAFEFKTRANIIVSLFSLFFLFYYKVQNVKKNKVHFFIIILFLSLSSATFLAVSEVNIFKNTKFYSEGIDTPRWEIWREYFNSLTVVEYLTGKEIGIDIFSTTFWYRNNPHNSFIRLHSILGILPFVFVFLFFIKNNSKISKVNLILFLILNLRLLTDLAVFRAPADLLYFIGLLGCFSVFDSNYRKNVLLSKHYSSTFPLTNK